MKLNKLNKFYICVAIVLIIAIIYSKIEYKSWERYNYSATINAPKTYPIHIRDAYFLTPDNDTETVDTENVNNFNTEWGIDFATSNHAKDERLPTQLVLKYFSYRDKNFYSDTLKLPQNQILRAFKSAQRNKQFLTLSSYAGEKKGLSFLIGIANNGNIIIWLRGIYFEEELIRVKLKPTVPTPDDLYYEKILTRDEYVKHAFGNLSDSLKTVYQSGFDGKANYIDTPSNYIEKNTKLWEYQMKNGFIDFKKETKK